MLFKKGYFKILLAKITDCPCVTCLIKYQEQQFAKLHDFRHISFLLDFGLVRLLYNPSAFSHIRKDFFDKVAITPLGNHDFFSVIQRNLLPVIGVNML